MIPGRIQQTLRRVRNRLAWVTLSHELLLGTLLLSTLFTTMTWYESRLYLSTIWRNLLAWSLLDLGLFLGLIILVRWFGTWRGWWPWVSYRSLAGRIGYRLDDAEDRLLNALQLEQRLAEQKDVKNRDLLARSVELVAERLVQLDFKKLAPRRYTPPVRPVLVMLTILALSWILHPVEMGQAAGRLFDPAGEYPVPKPFILFALGSDREILGGDTTEVAFTCFEAIPPALELVWVDSRGKEYVAPVLLERDRFIYRFEDIRDDVRYYARYRNPSWFAPWKEITSQAHTLSIIDRPVIENLTFHIVPPEYTGEPAEDVGSNVADITALIGSEVQLLAVTNLDLQSAWLDMGGTRMAADVDGNTVAGSFLLERSTSMSVLVVDERDVSNADPIRYRFTALPDYPPALTVLAPLMQVDLDEAMVIPVHFDVSDDYGFSRAQITYSIRHPDYLTQDDQIHTASIPGLLPDRRSQRVMYTWDVDQLSLAPGDELEFHIEVYDNNVVSGPGKAVSAPLKARVPTLSDLFARMSDESEEVLQTSDVVLEDLEEVKALLEEMDLAFRDDQTISWEQQQKGKEVLQNLAEIMEALESVQNQLRELEQTSEDHELFSEGLLQKYDELQQLLEQIMTAELEEAMNELREALQKMDPERFRDALQNMQFHAGEFEAQLDRFLDIFRQALAEMKMEEVVERMERLVAAEEQLLDKLAEIEPNSSRLADSETSRRTQDLAARHREQERDFDIARQAMGAASEAMRPYSPQAADRLLILQNSDLTRETVASLQQGTRSLQDQETANGQLQLQQSRDMMQALASEANDIQQQFQYTTVNEMIAQFQKVMNSILTISKQQEEIHRETGDMPRNSPRIREAAERQHQLLKEMASATEQLVALSRQTFNITPEMGRTIGRTNAAMNRAVEYLAANDSREASRSQRESMSALNETAQALSNAMVNMQQSGSASGFEQYLQRMKNLSQGQQGLNAQTMNFQLGNMAGMSKVELMRRLQARQRQLAQVLQEILNDFPNQTGGQGGGLGETAREMEEVIRDFQRRRVSRRTVERQQSILSRLLDSQKSLAVQDYKEERRGTPPAEQFIYSGPSGLPANLGEREDLILQAMERALRSGYSQEYTVLIQNYFQRLANESIPEE